MFALVPLVDPTEWIRVDDPDAPGALARSATGAVLAAPPTDGTRWRAESVPELTEPIAPEGDGGDPAALTNADLWHADGITGRGVKIAVFDLAWYLGDSSPVAVGDPISHDCYVSPTCEVPFDPLRPNTAGEGGHHGWACAEAIHTVAPGAELHVVRADSFTLYENAVDWAIREGVDVVSMSMSFYNDSFYDGTGPHDDPIRRLAEAGVLMVTSSGNDAVLNWLGPYVDANDDGRLDGDAGDAVSLYLDKSTAVYLSWNQFGARCGDTDLDLVVLDAAGRVVGQSTTAQVHTDEGPECKPVDIARPVVEDAGWFRVEVHHRRGARVGLDVQLLSRAGTFADPSPGSVTDPAVHPLAVAVGAVRAGRYWEGPPEAYSSWGKTRMGLPKPEIMGPDGLSGTAYGPVAFYGTSASTPVVAGLVALVMEDDPTLGSREAFERLQGWAHRPSPQPGEPPDLYGAGLARLPVRDPSGGECGRRPLWMCVLAPLWLRRRAATGS
ncbi:MAG: S8 family serine peptidase [Myxococcota bacterium]